MADEAQEAGAREISASHAWEAECAWPAREAWGRCSSHRASAPSLRAPLLPASKHAQPVTLRTRLGFSLDTTAWPRAAHVISDPPAPAQGDELQERNEAPSRGPGRAAPAGLPADGLTAGHCRPDWP